MTISRRDVIALSGSTLAGLSLGALTHENLEAAQAPQQAQPPSPRNSICFQQSAQKL